MGSWDVSCALTGTPIFVGDECSMVIFKKSFDPHEDSIELHAAYHIEKVVKSTYDDYGRVAETPDASSEYLDSITENGAERYHIFICKKAWDWAVDRYPVDPRYMNVRYDFHVMEGVEAAKVAAKNVKSREEKDNAITQALREVNERLKKLIPPPLPSWVYEMQSVFSAFRYCCRNPLAGYYATGQYTKDYCAEIRELARITEERLQEAFKDHDWLNEV